MPFGQAWLFFFYLHHLWLSLFHLLHGLLLIFALDPYFFPQMFHRQKSMHEEFSSCWVVYHLLPFMVWNPLWNHISLYCHPSSSWQFSKLTNCCHDLRQSSDFSLQYVIYMSLLTQQGFFVFFFLFALLLPSMCYSKMLRVLAWRVWDRSPVSADILKLLMDFKAKSQFSILVCVFLERSGVWTSMS